MSGGGRSARAVTVFGVSALVVYVAALALTPTNAPNSKSTGVRIAHYAAAHRHHLLAGDLLAALGLALLVLFAAALYRMIRRAESEDGWLAVGSLASILAGAGIFGVGTVLLCACCRPGRHGSGSWPRWSTSPARSRWRKEPARSYRRARSSSSSVWSPSSG